MVDLYLFKTALQDLARAKRLLVAAVLALTPGVIGAFWMMGAGSQGNVIYNTLASGLIFGFLLVILAAVFGTGALAQDIEQKTIVYLLVRPVPRWRILLARFAAAAVATTLALWVAAGLLALVTFRGGAFAQEVVRHDMLMLPVSAVTYGSVFLCLATLVPRPLVLGLLYAFGWETWVPTMGGDFQRASIIAYLRVLAPHVVPEPETVDFTGLLSALTPTSAILPETARIAVALIFGVSLFGALLIFSCREYVPRDDA